MDIYDELLRWAKGEGVELFGIEPRRIPGRGIGVVATKDIQKDDRILHVPTTTLRAIETVPKHITKNFPKDARVHGLLAADLALETLSPTSKYAAWNAVVPSQSDIFATLPLAWDPALHPFLPPPALSLVQKQLAKFALDHASFQTSLPSLPSSPTVPRDTYLYTWLLTNTRTFYFETPRTLRLRLPRDDRMVLQPVADLFNHAAAGCAVSFDAASFTITADRPYAAGDEVYICYGQHSNDFLLAEYGFVLEENGWDEVGLDEAVLAELDGKQRERLEERGFLGGYVLDADTVCYRTQVALRLLCVPLREWRRFVDGGVGEGEEAAQAKVDRLLVKILRRYLVKIDGTLETLSTLEVGEVGQREMLSMRWQQIRGLVDKTIMGLES
ncbi:hypothetical protein B0T25DRAFT_587507 [Lasiosphaeria hispida]|uniref:SET domain-containing protein n=1 Tax=Lasiosphaeria hispida TaxID=260671 RepID=A0AAJ0HVS6_9PEZI|nr:hypothetical protein B0T25DRAFT_587507 [Lasiosphaeria hispida]